MSNFVLFLLSFNKPCFALWLTHYAALYLGKEHNFNTYDDTVSSALGFPYDYTSVMHYSKTAFNKDTKPTIVTKIPEFMDMIGQRMEFSSSDVRKLNRLYNCSKCSPYPHHSLFMISIKSLIKNL